MAEPPHPLFQLFNEVGIIHQLSTAMFNRKMPDGLHVSHFAVLNHFVRLEDGKTPLELANAFQVTKGTMTHTLGELSKRGLIRVDPNPRDRRSKLVFLTDEGRLFHGEAIASVGPAIAELEQKFEDAKVLELLPGLRELRELLDRNRDI